VSPLSGVELCWEARLTAGRQRTIYVLLMAPAGDRATKIEALDCGADEVIDEPPYPDELLAKLRVAERMMTLKKELIRKASTDPLSGLYNRAAFFGKLTAACREAKDGGSLCVIFLDVDRFKAINDRYGHDTGDRAIRAVADVSQDLDVPVGRLGGDEFSVLLRGCNLEEALDVASELRTRFSEVQLETAEGPIGLTCSLGVGEFHPGDTADDLMKRADLALYRAKDGGGDNVATTPPDSWMNGQERRSMRPASDRLVARVCAVMDLLITAGLSEDLAARAMAQRLTAAGVPAPSDAAGDWCVACSLEEARCVMVP
jgi:two-component system cell cycle response regulator